MLDERCRYCAVFIWLGAEADGTLVICGELHYMAKSGVCVILVK